MLPGVVPFPPEYAKRYRAKGYWQDKTLAQEFAAVWKKYADRIALVDGEREFSYADIDRITDNLALNLLELGLKPLDRVVPTLPNISEFVMLYFALQKIGAIPIAALVTHRYAEISQFVQLSGATTCVYPERQGDFEFEQVQREVVGDAIDVGVAELALAVDERDAVRIFLPDGGEFLRQRLVLPIAFGAVALRVLGGKWHYTGKRHGGSK